MPKHIFPTNGMVWGPQRKWFVSARVMPFVIGVVLNDDEVTGTADTDTNEQDTTPGGIVGFHLIYTQQC